MGTLLVLNVASSVILIALSLPLLLEKIRPNSLYGFRLAPVFDSERIWYATNKYSAKWLLAAGVGNLSAATGLYFVPGLTVDHYAWACLAVLVAVLVPGFIASLHFARRLAAAEKGAGAA